MHLAFKLRNERGHTMTDPKRSLLKTRHATNPFVSDAKFIVPTRRSAGEKIITAQGPVSLHIGDESVEAAQIATVREVDTDVFVKLFVSQIRVFFDLSPGAMRLFLILLRVVGRPEFKNVDRIVLNESIAREIAIEHGQQPMSKSAYFRALNDLVEGGFIAPASAPPLYYINPALLFNGSRVRFITELRKKSETDDAVKTLDQSEGPFLIDDEDD